MSNGRIKMATCVMLVFSIQSLTVTLHYALLERLEILLVRKQETKTAGIIQENSAVETIQVRHGLMKPTEKLLTLLFLDSVLEGSGA